MFKNKIQRTWAAIKLVFRNQSILACLYIILAILIAISLPIELALLTQIFNSLSTDTFSTSLLLSFVLLNILEIVASFLKKNIGLTLKNSAEKNATLYWMRKLENLEFASFENSDYLDLIQFAENAAKSNLFAFYDSVITCLIFSFQIIGILIFFYQVHILLSIIFLIMVVFTVFLDSRAMKMMNTMFAGQGTADRKFTYYEEAMQDPEVLSVLKIYHSITLFQEKIHALASALKKERIDTTLKSQRYTIFSYLLSFLFMASALLILLSSSINQDLATGLLVSAISALFLANTITEQFSYNLSTISENYLYVDKYFTLLDMPEIRVPSESMAFHADSKSTAVSSERAKATSNLIEFKNVSFTYPGTEKVVLQDISFQIDTRKNTALVGPNGSGKSTIMKLLLGLYPVDSGEILYKGKNIQDYSRSELAQAFAPVFQNFAKYDFSIYENFALSNDVDVSLVSNIFGILDLEEFRGRENIELGKLADNNQGLSGGQWQKLAVGRALYKQQKTAAFLVMDEPLASLDPRAERLFYSQVEKLKTHTAYFIISHRLSSTRLADIIYVLEDGKLVTSGAHQDLITEGGLYAEMYEKEKSWYVSQTDESEDTI